MGDDIFNRFRLSLMQDVLPVSLAMFERIKHGEAVKVVETLTSSSDPLQELREEGEAAAKDVRERLDQLRPGLGNPIMEVSVEVDKSEKTEDQDIASLSALLIRIEERLDNLKTLLNEDASKTSLFSDQNLLK